MKVLLYLGAVYTQALEGQFPEFGKVPKVNDEWTKLISDQSASATSSPEYLTCVSEYDWAFTYGFI
jgi:hypothetical protein